jgi:hypothetical protein
MLFPFLFHVSGKIITIKLHWRRTLVLLVLYSAFLIDNG